MAEGDPTDIDYSSLRRHTWASVLSLLGAVLASVIAFLALTGVSAAYWPHNILTILAAFALLLPLFFLLISAVVTVNFLIRPSLVLGSGFLMRFIIREAIRG
ncbi:MAG: hypothetical protein JNK01_12985 [Devosia sp.]|nr:hypothetical protein [Devosia sp.]